jgi:hypothetical protein
LRKQLEWSVMEWRADPQVLVQTALSTLLSELLAGPWREEVGLRSYWPACQLEARCRL